MGLPLAEVAAAEAHPATDAADGHQPRTVNNNCPHQILRKKRNGSELPQEAGPALACLAGLLGDAADCRAAYFRRT